MYGFDTFFAFQIFPNKTMEKMKKCVKVRDELLNDILRKCKVGDRAENMS